MYLCEVCSVQHYFYIFCVCVIWNNCVLLYESILQGNNVDAGSGHGSAANGSAKNTEITGSGLVDCHFSVSSSVFPYYVVLQLVFH